MKDYFASLRHTDDPINEVARFLRAANREETLVHCRVVAKQACKLAARFGLSAERADLAASCHDLAAVVPYSEAVLVAESLGVTPDPVQVTVPLLLHGPIAAAIMQQRLGIDDQQILDAVRYHTICRPGAAEIELVVFVADKIALDPQSPVSDFVPAVRKAARNSLQEAAFVYLDWVLTHGPQLGWLIHPNVSAAHAELG